MPPETYAELVKQHMQAQAAARERRAEVRRTTPPAPLTVDALLERLQLSREVAEHIVQSYCECGCWSDIDGGWWMCPHGVDLGLEQT